MMIDRDIQDTVKKEIKKMLGLENLTLIDFNLFSKKSSYIVRVTTDYPKGGITINDCARMNKLLFSYLDKEKILGDDFVVEVISPGLNRKLKDIN